METFRSVYLTVVCGVSASAVAHTAIRLQVRAPKTAVATAPRKQREVVMVVMEISRGVEMNWSSGWYPDGRPGCLPNRCFSPLHPYRHGLGTEPDIRAPNILGCMGCKDAIPLRGCRTGRRS